MRHLIVEGMDGSGKDTLIADLVYEFPGHTLHERASTSLGGPVSKLEEWVVQDVSTMHKQQPSIYNRHPLISEPIYAPVREVNNGLRGVWAVPAWIHAYRRLASLATVLVVCQPPFEVVEANLMESGREAHMPGVMENRLHLYGQYTRLMWPGRTIRYDYTKNTVSALCDTIRKAIL